MLFSSYAFIFVFVPATLLAFHLANRLAGVRGALWALVLASLVFYGMWDTRFLGLLLASIGLNWLTARGIAAAVAVGRDRAAGMALAAGICGNLGLLAWFKYAGFLAASVNSLFGSVLPIPHLLLPLGISFFTFEQLAYLVDVRRGAPAERDPLRYALFVAFFPRLVAGPILRYGEIMSQVPRSGRLQARGTDLAVGMTLFAIGLVKKALLADGIAPYANAVFADAAGGAAPDLLLAWGGVLAYALQLYFDFSGYSDMAIGTARCFGLRFPVNFNSPYKAGSLIEFWRRWHMTLSRVLRDYLYVALGGNRRGLARRHVNLMLTMLLGGLWHGANWTFVIWGALHGAGLIVNHAWAGLCVRAPRLQRAAGSAPGRLLGWLLTMLLVLVGWALFRAPDFGTAGRMLAGMAGLQGLAMPDAVLDRLPGLRALGITASDGSGSRFMLMWAWVMALGAVALGLPNSQQWLVNWRPVLEHVRAGPAVLQWRMTPAWSVTMAVVALAGLISASRGGEFLYWQF